MKTSICLLLLLVIVSSFNQKKLIHHSDQQNEATLVISGPGFNKETKYQFAPDMLTVGGYDKFDKYTKIGFSRTFTDKLTEVITISIDVDLLSNGSLQLDPGHDGPQGHAGIGITRYSADGNSSTDIAMLSKGGNVTIEEYSAAFVKGTFTGTFKTAEEQEYKVQCHFKILRTK
jgi:hypothetical protein